MEPTRTVQCSESDCPKKPVARGYCRSHYAKHRRSGALAKVQHSATECSVDGCDRGGRFTRGLCTMHYARLTRHGETGGAEAMHAVSYDGKKCRIDDCGKTPKSRGYCTAHYKRLMRHGHPLGGRRARTWEESFNLHCVKGEGCWEWGGVIHGGGYGVISSGRNTQLAHRWSYEHHVGEIPEGLVIDHLCRNRSCVNPAHLEPVTNEENLRRGAGYGLQNGMRTTCINGHEYTAENTYTGPDGGKRCRTCARILSRKRSQENNEREAS